jgi:hypothetical protein
MALQTMLHNQFKSFENKIETNIENIILGLESELQKMDARLQEIEKQNQEKNQST